MSLVPTAKTPGAGDRGKHVFVPGVGGRALGERPAHLGPPGGQSLAF